MACLVDYLWPKTPKGDTIVIRQCEPRRVGYNERTCKGPAWMDVLDNCVNEELNQILISAAVSIALNLLQSYNSHTFKLIWNIGSVLVNVYVLSESACILALQ